MTKQNKIVLNSNIYFIQLKLYDFSDDELVLLRSSFCENF